MRKLEIIIASIAGKWQDIFLDQSAKWLKNLNKSINDAPIYQPIVLETTALGIAYLAGLHKGLFPPPPKFTD